MPVLIISANALLREVLAGTLSGSGLASKRLEPGNAIAAMRRDRPPVIIADNTLAPTLLAELFGVAQSLPRCRVILVDPSCNDLVVVDLQRQAIKRAVTLVEAVRAGLAVAATVDELSLLPKD